MLKEDSKNKLRHTFYRVQNGFISLKESLKRVARNL